MEMINRPYSETASKIIFYIVADSFYQLERINFKTGITTIVINAEGKLRLSKSIGVSIKTIENCITELVYLKVLNRTDKFVYEFPSGFVIETKDQVIIPTTYIYSK